MNSSRKDRVSTARGVPYGRAMSVLIASCALVAVCSAAEGERTTRNAPAWGLPSAVERTAMQGGEGQRTRSIHSVSVPVGAASNRLAISSTEARLATHVIERELGTASDGGYFYYPPY